VNHDELLDAILAEHEAAQEAQAKVQEHTAERARLIREALAAGVGAKPITQTLGLGSTQRIYAMAKQG